VIDKRDHHGIDADLRLRHDGCRLFDVRLPWGRRRLAYQINDHRDALYVLYRFIARAEAIVEIEREIKLDTNVIRYLVVRYDELTEHEERPPRQQADGPGGPGGPGGPSFRRPRTDAPAATEAPAATATAEAPAEAAAPAAEEAAPVAEEAESQSPASTDEPERPSGDPEAASEEMTEAEPE
jgi:small subunit ribosomal protein S6